MVGWKPWQGIVVGVGAVALGLALGLGAFVLVRDPRPADTASSTNRATVRSATSSAPVSTATTLPAPPGSTVAPSTSIPIRTASTEAGSPPVPDEPALSTSDAEARVARYLSNGSAQDVEDFVDEWAYPIRNYYGRVNSSEADVRSAFAKFWEKWESVEFIPEGNPIVSANGPSEVRITEWYTFHNVRANGEQVDGRSQLTLVVMASDLRVIEAIE